MSNRQFFFLSMLCSSVAGGLVAALIMHLLADPVPPQSIESRQSVQLSRYQSVSDPQQPFTVPEGLNFLDAAKQVTAAVVHIKTRYRSLSGEIGGLEDMFHDFLGDRPGHGDAGARMSSGSGVIISDDGYVATNYHVIEGAGQIEVVLNDKRSFRARVIGTDPTTDLALLKINEKDLPFVPYGTSDDVKVGQWVLAVGNPFDLTSTVTAGIVSAKARNINILRTKVPNYAIEAFIQTDAAVNPGNSGGALVDLNGKLIGVNTAIATNTGSFAGYSFAIPVDLVKKVMDDLLLYGEVQRALMGVTIVDLNADFAERRGLKTVEGVYIEGVGRGSGAEEAGILSGDIILSIEGQSVHNTSRLQELVARNRPGDRITVTYFRSGKTYKTLVTLRNKNNNTEIVRTIMPGASEIKPLQADLIALSEQEKEKLVLDFGLRVVKVREGILREARIEEGFVITHADEKPLFQVSDLENLLASSPAKLVLEGMYPNGHKARYELKF
jgi:Do/DeqQ family serine protease